MGHITISSLQGEADAAAGQPENAGGRVGNMWLKDLLGN